MKVLMHRNSMDVAFEVKKLGKYKHGFYHLKGHWINLGYTGNSWPVSTTETIVVPENEYKENWVDITGLINKPRTYSGLPK